MESKSDKAEDSYRQKMAAIAFICGNTINGKYGNYIYDRSNDDKPYSFVSVKAGTGYSVYDFGRKSYYMINENIIFDTKTKSCITISFYENRFSGFDNDIGYSFNGSVVGRKVNLFVCEKGEYINYLIMF